MLRANLGDEIYEIFVEEINEILENFQSWIPDWIASRDNTELLREIRRAYHTCKGSGRMVGALALGDYAWAHESMLNQVLEKQLPCNDVLSAILDRSLSHLTDNLNFFLTADAANAATKAEIDCVEHFIAHPDTMPESLALAAAVLEPNPGGVAETADANVTAKADADEQSDVDPHDNLLEGVTDEGTLPELAVVSVDGRPVSDEQGCVAEAPPASEIIEIVEATETEINESDTGIDDDEERLLVWRMFREELPEQLLAIDQQIQHLYTDPKDAGALQVLERELHTLKGSSRMAQLLDMGDAAHQAEELLEKLRRQSVPHISDAELEAVQTHIDLISSLAEHYMASELPVVSTLKTDEKEGVAEEEVSEASVEADWLSATENTTSEQDTTNDAVTESTYASYLERILAEQSATLPDLSILESIAAFSADQDTAPETHSAVSLTLPDQEQVRLPAAYLDKMIGGANALNIQQNTLSERLEAMSEDVSEFGRTALRLKQLLRSLELETETQIYAGYRQSEQGSAHNARFDPLEMDEYSEIQRLSRSLAESLNDLVNIQGDLSLQLRAAERFVGESLHTSRELHQDLLTTRLVDVGAIVPRLRRIIRQTATELGRKVTLDVVGEDLKLDRHLLQRMTAPIEHVLRNAVFHGIEDPEEREAQGKSENGGVLLEVQREDTEVVITVSDDGRGLDRDKITKKAIEAGLIHEGDQLAAQDIYRLILRSGFTTAEQVSQVAGRGVGMDVVSSEIKALGGSLLIDSDKDAGTEFTIRLPFTMAANPVLFVEVQEQQYALPLSAIQGLVRLDIGGVQAHLGQADSPLLFNDQTYALHYLGTALDYQRGLELRKDNMYVVVCTRLGGHHIAWVVDAISGRRDVVLQSLGAVFKACRFYSAATVTSDGEVVMVPDMLELTEQISRTQVNEIFTADNEAGAEMHSQPTVRHEHPHIMVVDDSITVRKVTEKLLLNENFIVETAKDGLEALEKLDLFVPDLILLDIEMPRMDGFELLRSMRMESRWQALPVIMISSRTAEKHMNRAMELGATDFLGKPYQNQSLLKRIDQHLIGHGAKPAVIKEEIL